MENVIVGRIVHLADPHPDRKAMCRPFILTDIHSPTVVSGQVLLSPFDKIEDPDGTSIWVTSVMEELARTETVEGHEKHTPGLWHDPRLC